MGPRDAFRKLGYEPKSVYDWVVVSEKGVCLALWAGEIDWKCSPPEFDTRIHSGDTDWRSDPKALKRLQQLAEAIRKFDGRVDVVLRDGKPSDNKQTAQPWLAIGGRVGTFWRCIPELFDPEAHEFVIRLYRD